MKRLSLIFFIYALTALPSIARTVSDNKIGYSLTLPDNWVCYSTSDTLAAFEDTTGKYQAVISIYYKNFTGESLFTLPDEWTRAHFISYELTINSDPLCALVFFDTVSIKQSGTYWAPEVYSYNFEIDTAVVSDWAVYIRFTEVGKSGYELYAIGPIPDLDSNLAYYTTIIDGFALRGSNNPVVQPPLKRFTPQASLSKFSSSRFNLLGRRVNSPQNNQLAPQLIIRQQNKFCYLP